MAQQTATRRKPKKQWRLTRMQSKQAAVLKPSQRLGRRRCAQRGKETAGQVQLTIGSLMPCGGKRGSAGATLTALWPTCLTRRHESPPLRCQDPPRGFSPSAEGPACPLLTRLLQTTPEDRPTLPQWLPLPETLYPLLGALRAECPPGLGHRGPAGGPPRGHSVGGVRTSTCPSKAEGHGSCRQARAGRGWSSYQSGLGGSHINHKERASGADWAGHGELQGQGANHPSPSCLCRSQEWVLATAPARQGRIKITTSTTVAAMISYLTKRFLYPCQVLTKPQELSTVNIPLIQTRKQAQRGLVTHRGREEPAPCILEPLSWTHQTCFPPQCSLSGNPTQPPTRLPGHKLRRHALCTGTQPRVCRGSSGLPGRPPQQAARASWDNMAEREEPSEPRLP